MCNFYLNSKQFGNCILYRGIHNGKRIQKKVDYKPSLFVPTKEETKYKTIYGEPLKKIKQNSIKEAKDFIKQYEGIENFKIYGNTKYEYCLISDLFPDDVEWDISKIRIAIFDIEVNSDPETGGFAEQNNAFQPIISIALKFFNEDKFYLFGFNEFDAPENVQYFRCKDEWTLLKTFIEVWSSNYPDIVSGWNVEGFDVPYLINRCYKVLGEPETKKLSPWNLIRDKRVKKFNQKFNQYEEDIYYSIFGISTLDYLDLFKKYHPEGKSQESYKLDSIAEKEINQKKVEYDGSLHRLYVENPQKFYEYNIQDVNLVELIDNKCKLFELGLTLSYDSKTNPEDIFHQTRMWDSLIFNFLKKRNTHIPQIKIKEDSNYEGAYVKPPIAGLHRWVVTLDATSLYPSIIMGKNISPETIIEPEDYTENMRALISRQVSVDKILSNSVDLSILKEEGITITPNGQLFRTDRKGFLPEMVETMFAARQTYKKKKLKAEQEYEEVCAELNKRKKINNMKNE